MLQRIQTIWMLLCLIGTAILFVCLKQNNSLPKQTGFVLLSGLAALIAFFSIISYKKRKRQLLLNSFGIVINALLIGFLIAYLLSLPGGFHFPEKGIELALPIFSIICLLLANKWIRKDEKLVKSVDRIR